MSENTPQSAVTPSVDHLTFKPEDRPTRSITISKLATALAKAQGEMENADKDGKGTYGNYATLAATWLAIRKPLSKNEIAIYQRILTIGGKPTMCTMLVHSSGEFMDDCELELKFDANGRMNAMQAMGSAVTYSRRYSLQAVTGIAPQDDDDGAGSGDAKQQSNQQRQTQNQTQGQQKNQQQQGASASKKATTAKAEKPPEDASAEKPSNDPADFVMPFGQNKGSRIGSLDEQTLRTGLTWCEGQLKSTPPPDNISQIFDVANAIKAFFKTMNIEA